METSSYILGFLLLLFTIEDLIGTEKVRRLEKNWITRSRQTLFAWRNSLSETTRWWPKLLYLATSEFFILFLIGAVLNWTVTGNFGTWQGLSWLVAAIGWVGLVVGGVTVAGVAAAASIGMNIAVKENSGSWYDSLMNSLGIK